MGARSTTWPLLLVYCSSMLEKSTRVPSVWNWKRTVPKLKGVASAEEESQAHVHSPRHSIRVPSVIRLLEYRRIPHQTRALSRKNILMRDRYTCQYCHRTVPSGELTLDHVVPRSRAGETTWENLVACCHPCNNRKGSRTPEEAGMKLARAPRPFSLHTSRHLMRLLAKSDDQWRKYLFY